METENPMPAEEGAAKARRIPELERGVGLHILRELAVKYDGSFTAGAQDGVFSAKLLLKEVTDHAEYSDL